MCIPILSGPDTLARIEPLSFQHSSIERQETKGRGVGEG